MRKYVNIFDISSHLYAAYKQFTKDGTPTNPDAYYKGEPVYCLGAVLGMVHKDLRLAAEIGHYNTHTIIVFDHPDRNFRHDIYPDYKSSRPPKDPEYIRQYELAYDMFQTQGFACLCEPGVETDDVIGTIAKKLDKAGVQTLIHSRDKDILVSVTDNVRQYDRISKIYYDRQEVIKKMGVPPEKVTEFLTLKGDVSDSIPGVPGVADGYAKILLEKYSLRQLIREPELIKTTSIRGKDKISEYFKNHSDNIIMAHELVKLRTDINLKTNLADFVKREPQAGNFLELIL